MNKQVSIDELKSEINILDYVKSIAPDLALKASGPENWALCPFHDERTPSFSIREDKQFYYCQGCGAGGTVIDFAMEYNGLSLPDAIKDLKKYAGYGDGVEFERKAPAKIVIKKTTDESELWEPVTPVPATAPKLMKDGWSSKIYSPKTGKTGKYNPDDYYVYRDTAGNILGVVFRLVFNNKKITPTITYCTNKETGEQRWVMRGFDSPRPLYNQDLLIEDEEKPVLVVEGEKSVDFVDPKVSNDYITTTWSMGTNSMDKTDWSLLYGRNVTLWADNDLKTYQRGVNEGKVKPENEQSGRKAMLWIKKHLEENGAKVVLLDQPIDRPDGWDGADLVEEGGDVIGYIADHTPYVEEIDSSEPDEPKELVIPQDDIRAIGYDGELSYYYSKFTRQVRALKAKEHTANNFLSMAESSWWLSKFDNGKDSIDWQEASSYMMSKCRLAGIYDAQRLRGRGCWIDDGRIVLHLGDQLIVNGEPVELDSFQSKYVYQASRKKRLPVKPLDNESANGIIQAMSKVGWERPASALLLAGWCVLAPICGTLDWRPHIWITGGSGSGKSTIKDCFIKTLVDDMGMYLTLRSTTAGVQQEMKADAFSIVIDEFVDYGGRATKDKIQAFLDMMRDASGGNEVVLKGSTNGQSVRYECHSMVALMGIQVCTNEQAVLNRTAQLALKSHANKTIEDKKRNEGQWSDVQHTIDQKIYAIPNIGNRLFARTLDLIDVIHYNIKVFKKAANTYFGSARHADQYGSLLAGAYSLISDSKVNEMTALNFIESYDWDSYTEDSEEDEQTQALSDIMQINIRVEGEGMPKEKTIGEWVDMSRSGDPVGSISKQHIDEQLARHGIKVRLDGIVIANNNDKLSKLLQGKPWGIKWSKFLKRLTDLDGNPLKSTKSPVYFHAGYSQRAVEIPWNVIFNGLGVD